MFSVVRVFAVFFASIFNIEAFIHRLPCKLYGKFDVKYLNRYFNTSSKIMFNNVTIEKCAMNCIAPNISGTALNYFYDNSTCEIFNHSFIYFQRENQLSSHTGSVFMTTTHDITKRGYKCSEMATSPCGEDEGCVDDCSQLGYKCIKLYLKESQITVESTDPSNSAAVIDNDFDTKVEFVAPGNWIKLELDKKYTIYYLKMKVQTVTSDRNDRFIHIGNVNENAINNPLCARFVNENTMSKISCTSGDEIRYARYIYIYREESRALRLYEVRVFTDYMQ